MTRPFVLAKGTGHRCRRFIEPVSSVAPVFFAGQQEPWRATLRPEVQGGEYFQDFHAAAMQAQRKSSGEDRLTL